MKITQTEIVTDRISGTVAVSTTGKGEVVLGFNINEMLVDAKGDGHIVFSQKQARAFANIFMKHIDIARKGS